MQAKLGTLVSLKFPTGTFVSWRPGTAPQTLPRAVGGERKACLVGQCPKAAIKLPRTGQLITTENYSLTGLEARSPKLRFPQSNAPSDGSRRSLACGGMTSVSLSAFIWPSSLCVCLKPSPPLFYKDISIEFGVHP